jgi:tRNA nucleotidyltransferase (CCA-adding enzyme)
MRDEEQEPIAKLRKIEALFARPGTDGERHAAKNASSRIRARLDALAQSEAPVEYRFSLPDAWSRALFIAVLRRHGIRPYRHRGQRHTTVMVKVAKSYVDETLWPEFHQLQTVLYKHFEAVTKRVIARAMGSDTAEVELREDQTPEA